MSVRRHVYPDALSAARACARDILSKLETAIAETGVATLAISGGSSPIPMFQELAASRFDWKYVHLFWVDERAVPPTDSQSNYKLAKDHLLDSANFPERNVHRIEAELPPGEAARRYVAGIRAFFKLGPAGLPEFDVLHRGMGPDAHTASLFPGEPLIDDTAAIAAAVWVEKMSQWRITLLPGVLRNARHTVILAAGSDKAGPLREVLLGPYNPKLYPSQLGLRDSHLVTWFLDEPAARLLE